MSRINFPNPDDLSNLPLPVAHSDFDFTAKTLRDLGVGEGRVFRANPPNTALGELAARIVARHVERMVLVLYCPVIYFEDP
jgi:hypothetical protein